MKFKLIVIAALLFKINTFSQNSLKESWSFGAGISNFMMNGDLKATDSFFNIGAYLSANKMVSPSVGFELKFGYDNISGKGNDGSYSIYNTSLDKTKFEGTAISGEASVIYNLSTIFSKLHKNDDRKFNFSFLTGIGLQNYNSKLYHVDTNELLADFGNGPSENGTTSSLYYTAGLNAKYKINNNLALEFRQSVNVNEEDHLDAVVSNKSSLDYFFKSSVGIAYSLNGKENSNFAWHKNIEGSIEEKVPFINNDEDVTDSDNDGVIDIYDVEPKTPKGAIVYGNGVAIDSDKDGVIDLYDKCPLVYFKTATGCSKEIIKTPIKKEIAKIIPAKKEIIKPVIVEKEIAKVIPAKKKIIKPTPIKKEVTKVIPAVKEIIKSTPVEKEVVKVIPAIKEIIKPTSVEKEIAKVIPAKKEIIKSTPVEKEVAKVIPTKKEIIKPTLTKAEKEKRKMIAEINKKNTSHGNILLDNSVNINDVDISPVYPKCENKTSKFETTNCVISSISKYVDTNFDKNKAKKINGKIRVLFIVTEKGKIKVADILGDYSKESKDELRRVLETSPKIIPGKLNGISVPVKYSLLFLLN